MKSMSSFIIGMISVVALLQNATGAAAPIKPDRAALEKQFAESLSDVVLVGYFQMAQQDGLDGKALMPAPRAEMYAIEAAHKIDENTWQIRARIHYGEVDVTLPLNLHVEWAGDTPIITLDKVGMPGLGVYSARVMIYRNFYSGTWFGDCYGGVLSGQILKREVYEKLRKENPQMTQTDADKKTESAEGP